MESRFGIFLQRLSKCSVYGVIVLTPLMFVPLTMEWLELPKYLLWSGLVIIGTLSYLGKAVLTKTLILKRTAIDKPLIIMWALFAVSSIFSSDRFVSFFGDFSLTHISFMGVTAMVLFYWLVVQHTETMNDIVRLMVLLAVSGSLAAVYFILSIVHVLPAMALAPQFNVVHATNSLFGVFLTVLLVVTLTLSARQGSSVVGRVFAGVGALLSLAALVMIGFKLVWILVAVALILLIVLSLAHVGEIGVWWTSTVFALFVASILIILLGVPRVLSANIPIELALSPSVSWRVAADSLTSSASSFLIGSGPGTYQFAYSQFRPSSLNLDKLAWNIRLTQPWSTVLEWLTTTGMLSTLTFIVVLLIVLGLIIQTWIKYGSAKGVRRYLTALQFGDEPLVVWGLVAAWVTITVGLFIFSFGAVHWMVWWLLTALVISAGAILNKTPLTTIAVSFKSSPEYALVTSFSFIVVSTIFIVAALYVGRFYEAEVVFAKSLPKSVDERIDAANKAMGLNPYRTIFSLALANDYFEKARAAVAAKADTSSIYQLVNLAVLAGKNATTISPNNVVAWETLSTLYANAQAISPDAGNWAISALDKARSLEPTNPLLFVEQGNVYFGQKNGPAAVQDFEQAIKLKPDLLVAYSQLAFVYEAAGDMPGAIGVMERGLPNGGNNDPDFLVQLGRYYFNRKKQGDMGLSELAFRRALALNPNHLNATEGLAIIAEATNNRSAAIALYKHALELAPGNRDLERKIDLLGGSSGTP